MAMPKQHQALLGSAKRYSSNQFPLFPAQCRGRLGRDVVAHAVGTGNLGDNAAGNLGQHIVRQLGPVSSHSIARLQQPRQNNGACTLRSSPITPTDLMSGSTAKYCQQLCSELRSPVSSNKRWLYASSSSRTIASAFFRISSFSLSTAPIIRIARPGPGNG